MKKKYTTPNTSTVRLMTAENIAQFIISSHAVGEEDGLAKPGFFDEEEEEKIASPATSSSRWEDD